MKKSTGRFFLLFLLLTSFLPAVESELQPYKLINADKLIVEKVKGEFVTNLIGNVHLFYGETEFFADKADIYEKQKIAKMQGKVKVYDDSLSLFADNVEYFRLTEKLFLQGKVLAEEAHTDSTIRTFEADRVEYFRNEREFYAYDNVHSFDERENIFGDCGKLTYYLDDGYGYLIKSPILNLAGKDSLQISAEKIEYFKDYKKVIADFNVVTESGEFRMTSDFLLYFSQEEKAIYLGQPRFTSEFADAQAIEFQIFFLEQKINRAVLQDSCYVVFKTEEESEKNSWVKSTKMDFDFVNGRIELCDAQTNVFSYFEQQKAENKDFTVNDATGQRLIIKVNEENQIESIDMRTAVQGMYKFEKK
ncbi:MAG: LptA/OstA family protein [Candidatus Cloacimonadales bacterium]|nr:LptA/OstA family protein [Candidatus Cloacimonadales bacterium]